MTEAEARDRLAILAASGTFPTLTPSELLSALASARLADLYGFTGEDEVEWLPETAYALDDLVVPPLRDGWVYICRTAGTSGATEPTWGVDGEFADGTVEWEIVYGGWSPTHDMNRAAAAAWEIKAAKTSDRAGFQVDYKTFNPQQVFDHCIKMADMYRSRITETIRLVPESAADYDYAANWTLPRA